MDVYGFLRLPHTKAMLGLVLGLWAFEVRAEETTPPLAGQAELAEPGPELALALRRYLDLREKAFLIGSEAGAATLDAEASGVARLCGGKLPGDCLFAEALALAATVEEPEEKPRDAGWLTRSEAQARIVVFLTMVEDVDAARRLVLAIEDRTERKWAQRGILRVLASDGYYIAAIESLRDRDSNIQIAEGASEIVAALIAAGETETALEVQTRAIHFAKQISVVDARGKALARVAFHYLELEDVSAAMGLIGQIEDEYWKNALSIRVAGAMAAKGEAEAALRVAEGVTGDEMQETEALGIVAVRLAQAGQAEEARRVADRFTDPFDRAIVIARVAAGLIKAGQTDAALALFAEAEAMGAGLAGPEDQAVVLAAIAVAMIDASRSEQALALTETMRDLGGETDRMTRAYIKIAEALIAAGESTSAVPLLALAEGIAGQIAEDEDRSSTLLEIARLLIKGVRFADARRVAVGIGKPSYRVFALRDLAVARCEAGLGEGNTLADVLQIAQLIAGIEGDAAARGRGLVEVARALAKAGEGDAAEAVAGALDAPDWRAQALAEVATVLAEATPAKAERIARQIEDTAWRAVALAAVAAGLTPR